MDKWTSNLGMSIEEFGKLVSEVSERIKNYESLPEDIQTSLKEFGGLVDELGERLQDYKDLPEDIMQALREIKDSNAADDIKRSVVMGILKSFIKLDRMNREKDKPEKEEMGTDRAEKIKPKTSKDKVSGCGDCDCGNGGCGDSCTYNSDCLYGDYACRNKDFCMHHGDVFKGSGIINNGARVKDGILEIDVELHMGKDKTDKREKSKDVNKYARPTKDEYYLDITEKVAARSTCIRRKYGAVLVKNDRIISTGYNGSPRGDVNCCDIGYCEREFNKIPKGERYEMCKAIHAEDNAITHAGRDQAIGSTLYIVGVEVANGKLANPEPCKMCMRKIKNSGIVKVVGEYEDATGRHIKTIDIQ